MHDKCGLQILKISKQTYRQQNNMAASFPEPIVVLYKSQQCGHCNKLAAIWDTNPNKDEDSVTTAMKKIYPKIRFFTITAKDNGGKFDENTAPKDFIRYGKWFPMIVLVPGKLWDEAMSKLGPKNDVKLVDGIQVMNAKVEDGSPKYVQEYDVRKPVEFGRWLEKAISNEDFKRVQYGGTVVQPQPIPSLLTNIIKPNMSSHVINHDVNTGGDYCGMKIISRTK
ncbi:MAG: hypothetical protein ABIQ41_02015 [Gemmatimonadales bacterium]